MSDIKYSLCLSYPRLYEPDQYVLFRIADYDPVQQKLIQASYSQDEGVFDEPKFIGFHPQDTNPYSTTIRKWHVDEYEPKKTRSYGYELDDENKIHEVVFPPELKDVDYNRPAMIRNILKTGISIHEYACDDLLIVISSAGIHHAAIACKKSMFRYVDGKYCLQQNSTDMLHTVHCLNEYDISSYSIITTEDIGIRTTSNELVNRYFYNSTKLPDDSDYFNLYSLEDYIPQYISSYLKKHKSELQISNTNIQNIVSSIQAFLNDEDSISNYFSKTGYSETELIDVIPEFSSVVAQALLGNPELDDIISKCVFNNEEVLRRCIELAKEIWLAEKDTERQGIESLIEQEKNEIENQKKQINDLQNTVLGYEEDINDKKIELQEIINEISESNDELKKLKARIQEELNRFSNDLVEQIKISTIANASSNNSNSSSITYYKKSIAVEDSEEIDDKDDFEEILQDNIEMLGYGEFSLQIAQLIMFTVSNNMPLIISNNSRNIADAVAATFNNKAITIIDVPMGFTSPIELANVIKQGEKVCYISGVFDGCNDNLFAFITDYFKDDYEHFIIYSADGINPNLISCSVWNKAMFIDGSVGYDMPLSENFISVSNEIAFDSIYNIDELKIHKKWLQPFVEKTFISPITAYNISKFMNDISFDERNDFFVWLQLCLNLNSNNSDDIIDLIDNSSLKEKYKKHLISFVEEQ